MFIFSRRNEWALDTNVDLEVTNHVIRVFVQDRSIGKHTDVLLALVAAQHKDGGWGDWRDDELSHERSTAFCVQMLLRAERQVPATWLAQSIEAGLEFIASKQLSNGSWADHRWHTLDATSTSVGTLLFALNDSAQRFERFATVLQRGMLFVHQARDRDGMWFYKPKSSPVTITAHLIQKTVIFYGPSSIEVAAAHRLLELQDPEGHWDSRNIDHTCDATRSLMLTASECASPALTLAVAAAAKRAVDWLIRCTDRSGGLGDRPGREPHVERSCDGLDTLLKFKIFTSQQATLSNFWH
jgi:prenyltransferase beta subunit